MPEDVQIAMYHTVPGLENAVIVRNAYAIEYDCLCPGELTLSLELKKVSGLFSAGQFNGSSGYEEAAAQGLIAGINAARKLSDLEPVILTRSDAYIGVLIDDLVTLENNEPYRMMTSRAEYRLMLRQDNADLRLTKIGHDIGLISDERYEKFELKKQMIEDEIDRLKNTFVGANAKVQEFLTAHGSTPLKTAVSMAELIKRPELDYEMLKELDVNRPELADDVKVEVEINIKYDGYIKRQLRQVEQFKKLEKKKIPADINYDDVMSLRIEARDKLKKFSPANLGQASRIQGVSPADVSVLLVYIESKYRRQQ
jgi:tRNA uridine 5-carboxymethylaminomethyl modification enzyme